MDYVCSSMFLFEQNDHELLQYFSLDHYPHKVGDTDHSTKKHDLSGRGRRRKASTTFFDDDNNNKNPNNKNEEHKKKKVVHRDIERQRRQEMATLYMSLRSQLPLQYLKGKRSISDHMYEATNYIRHLEKKIEELKAKRDGLKELSNINNNDNNNDDSLNNLVNVDGHDYLSAIVIVKRCLVGVEVVIRTDSRRQRQELQLSRVLEIMNGEGLNIVNCISTQVNNHMLLHTIESEVSEESSVNISELQQKLASLTIRSSSKLS